MERSPGDEFAAEPARMENPQQDIGSSANVVSGDELKIIRHVAERLEDHRIFKVADTGTIDTRERHSSGARLTSDHHVRTPQHGRRVRTFDGLSGNSAAVLQAHEP
jgi:hypothetical protein